MTTNLELLFELNPEAAFNLNPQLVWKHHPNWILKYKRIWAIRNNSIDEFFEALHRYYISDDPKYSIYK